MHRSCMSWVEGAGPTIEPLGTVGHDGLHRLLNTADSWTAAHVLITVPAHQVASAGARPNVGTRLGSLNAVMREMRAPIRVRTCTPYASYRPSPARV